MEKYNKVENINPLKSEHLREDIRPIISCLCNRTELDVETKKMIENYKETADGVSGVSECNDHNKWSKESFLYCTGIIISGIEKSTGKNVSIMIHYNPNKFLEMTEGKEKAEIKRAEKINKISEIIVNIKEKCEDKTIDCVVFGGNQGDDLYKKSIKALSEVCSKKLGFEPVILTGPKMSREIINDEHLNDTDIYYDNDNRRLYLVRTLQTSGENESYLSSEIEEQSKKWIKR